MQTTAPSGSGTSKYEVLARKWRPRSFAELVGQQHVLKALVNALEQNRLHHAYLFTGTRGVGKTTIARILAKCLNCEEKVTATPCNQCEACQEINDGRFIDLIEVDAASRTKVEDMRELLDNVQYTPSKGRFKVYLIDEVHMLSGHSFNALLKTLEEPPPHVKFLLATTDPQKLPITVLSRCLQFNLKNLTPEQIEAHLNHILNEEKITFEPPALPYLARAAHGSVRDSLSLLDQAIAYCQGNLKTQDVRDMLGTIDTEQIVNLLNHLIKKDANACLDTIAHLDEHAADFKHTLDDFITLLHHIAVIQAVPDARTAHWEHGEAIKDFAKTLTPEQVHTYYDLALEGQRNITLAPSLKMGFEMVVLQLFAEKPIKKAQPQQQTTPQHTTTQSAKAALEPKKTATTPNTEKKPEANKKTSSPKQPTAEQPTAQQPTPEQSKPITPTSKDINWLELVTQLKIQGPTKALAMHCELVKIDDEAAYLYLEPNQHPLLNKMQKERLAKAFSDHFNKPMTVYIKPGTKDISTPAKIQNAEKAARQNSAEQHISADKALKNLIETFDANLIPGTIEPKETKEES